ncbi:hypothetical protein L596_022482 [Steinernema carpocapsae]|uniref:Uncharacterized protein n=1 Tax=Steinernema carpocapsae TaxID=34508 RepID=A0A4U5MMP8_STECR|nr:hypothetical protein L596_022482 [Steinernema carpocapsae]
MTILNRRPPHPITLILLSLSNMLPQLQKLLFFVLIFCLLGLNVVTGQCYIDENGKQHCNTVPTCVTKPDGSVSCVRK